MFLLAGTLVAGLLPRGAFADNVFKLRGAYSLKLTNAGDGTGISTGPCLAVGAAEEYVNLINNLNNGQGFEVVSELTNQTTYFKLNYSYATYTRSTVCMPIHTPQILSVLQFHQQLMQSSLLAFLKCINICYPLHRTLRWRSGTVTGKM